MNEATALNRIEEAQKAGSLVFVDKDWVSEKTPLFKPEVSEIKLDKENDCFDISGKFMPKREVVDRIGEASGIDFIFGEVRNVTIEDDTCGKRTVYTAVAQGRKMMSDGSYRTSSKCDYEFDPVLRAMLDFDVTELNEQTKQKRRKSAKGYEYGSTLARYILELQKVAAQRANTGARLRVIRELVGMPVAFAQKDIEKPLLFGRMVQNTEYILKTPEGRAMATAKALGVDIATLFGKPSLPPATEAQEAEYTTAKTTDHETEHKPETNTTPASAAGTAESNDEPDFPDEPTGPGSEQEDLLTQKGLHIEQLMTTYKDALDVISKNGKNPYKMAQEELANPNATIESRDSMIKRLNDWLKNKGINV
jgi:hypothetical protein